MQHAAAVSGGKAGTQLLRHLHSFVVGQAADSPQQGCQIFAVHKFHGKEEPAVALPDVIHATDVGMGNLPRHAHFGIELIAPTGALPAVRG